MLDAASAKIIDNRRWGQSQWIKLEVGIGPGSTRSQTIATLELVAKHHIHAFRRREEFERWERANIEEQVRDKRRIELRKRTWQRGILRNGAEYVCDKKSRSRRWRRGILNVPGDGATQPIVCQRCYADDRRELTQMPTPSFQQHT